MMEKLNNSYLVERVSVENSLVQAGMVEVQAMPMSDPSEFKNRVLNLFGDFNRETISAMMLKYYISIHNR